MKARIVAVILLLFLPAICIADFTVYFKDGSHRRVSQIHFKGEKADLYLSTGMVMTFPTNAIEFQATGIDPPKPDEHVIVYGKAPKDRKPVQPNAASPSPIVKTPVPAPAGPSQQELRRQWENSDRTATAIQTFGPIRSGETVKIIASTNLSYTIVHRQDDGSYHRMIISTVNFFESFKVEKPAVAPPERKQKTPGPVETVPTPDPRPPQFTPRLPREITPPPEPAGPRPTLWTPFALSVVLLLAGIGLTIALSRSPSQPERKRK